MLTRDAALNAAQRQLNRDPVKSMAELARGMGMARATLHRHFETRDALLQEIVRRAVSRWEKFQEDVGIATALESDDVDLVATCVRSLIRAYVSQPEDFGLAIFHHVLDQDPALRRRERDVARQEELLFKNAQRLGLLRSDLPTLWLSSMVWGLIIGARDALRDGDAAPSILANLVWTSFLEGTGTKAFADVWQAQRPPRF